MYRVLFILTLLSVSVAFYENSYSSELVYHGNNINITPTASPYSAAGIETRAALTRPKEKIADTSSQTEADLVKKSVLSSLSSTITQKLTGNTVGSGTVNFGDGSWAEFSTSIDNIRTIITHNLDGTSTTISFPL